MSRPVLLTKLALIVGLFISFTSVGRADAPAPRYSATVEGVEMNVVLQAPHLMATPLQVFGTFLYERKNDGFSGADLEMDEGFQGAIQDLRKNHGFGLLAEHIVLTPSRGGAIVAEKVLVIGLGDINKFKPEDMAKVGASSYRAACALGLKEFSYAADVQDGGMRKYAAGVIAREVISGVVSEIRLEKSLAAKGFLPACPVTKISYLAGPKYIGNTIETLKQFAQKPAAR